VSQFAKLASNKPKEEKESTVYGTTVIQNGNKYVKLDGSELLTPASFTTNIADGERVTVLIKNHMAIVTGNITSPAARTSEVEEVGDKADAASAAVENLTADNIKVNQKLEAQEGSIKNLTSDNVTIKNKLNAQEASIGNLEAENVTITGKLEAAEGNISNLQADNVTINESLTAAKASIKDLDTKKLSADQADIKYANIDFTNIGKAAIENFYATSGIIKDLVIGDTSVTGKLVGVTITGDLIEGGTVKADKLVILGEDGLYYKLNVNALGETTAASDPKYQNGLDGSVIVAKSITAEKVNVHDLVAFDATIGGFNISDSSIYSGAKESVTNGTRGIYLDKNGQISFGDADNFIRYYKDTDGAYKLEISAANISIKSGGEGSNLNDEISNIKNDVNSLRGEIASEEIRYYLLQSSTLEAPKKPTTYPPPSTWVTTEPVYSNPDNDPDTLYFVVCTVYTNGEFKYSDVLISSTYESIRNTETRINQTKSSIDFSITEQINTVRTDYKTYTDNALNGYVTNANYDKDKKNTDDKMSDMEDALSNKATKDDLNGFATSEQYNEIRKYISFTKDGIKISSDSTYQPDNPDAKHLTLTLDNDAIKFENNGVVIGRWDGSNFYTGDMVVELNQRAQFGNFALVPRSDKSLMFLKVQD
jgi:hypothetical protein